MIVASSLGSGVQCYRALLMLGIAMFKALLAFEVLGAHLGIGVSQNPGFRISGLGAESCPWGLCNNTLISFDLSEYLRSL